LKITLQKKRLRYYKKIEDRVRYNTYDSVNIRKEKDFNQEMALALEFYDFFGIEIDLDSFQILPVVQ
jgi:formiminoglutamase